MSALIGRAGESWRLERVPVPDLWPGQALVRVRAAGVNRADLSMLDGTYLTSLDAPVDYPAGLELAGEIAAVTDEVQGLAVGDRVMGTTLGAFADFAVVNHRHLIPVPDGVPWEAAGALPVGLTTEHDALKQAGFEPGQTVLVVGATSGIGLIGVRLAKTLGAAMVIATTSSAGKADTLRAAGADVVIDTGTQDLAETVRSATAGVGADVALDHVGGPLFAEVLAAIKLQGTVINIGRVGGTAATIDLDTLSFRRIRVIGTTFSTRSDDERAAVAAALEPEVMGLVSAGSVRPTVDEVIPLVQADRALERLRANDVIGKLVLVPDATDANGAQR